MMQADVGVPFPGEPDQGSIDCAVSISPCAFKGTAGESMGAELGRILGRSLKWQEAGPGCAIDLTALKIVSGKRCWVLLLDGLVLSADGNLLDALSIATKAALGDLRIPRMEVNMGEDGDEPELELDDDPEQASSLDITRLPLIITVSQGIVCGIHKPGMAAIQPGRVMEMIGVGQSVGPQLHKAVASELYRLGQQLDAS